jgi:riboflavin synthase
MFTGLIHYQGRVLSKTPNMDGVEFVFETDLATQIQVNDSVAVNGVCLTATAVNSSTFKAQVVAMSLQKTTLGKLQMGERVNLELAMRLDDRLGGHLVQGHVSGVGQILDIKLLGESWEIVIQYPPEITKYLILEGSIAVEGISLTLAKLNENSFTLAIIPHTLKKTTLSNKKAGDFVNLEVDLIAKYVEKLFAPYVKSTSNL